MGGAWCGGDPGRNSRDFRIPNPTRNENHFDSRRRPAILLFSVLGNASANEQIKFDKHTWPDMIQILLHLILGAPRKSMILLLFRNPDPGFRVVTTHDSVHTLTCTTRDPRVETTVNANNMILCVFCSVVYLLVSTSVSHTGGQGSNRYSTCRRG